MINQGLVFTGEGPLMDGTWYNPNTGDNFTVRDSFFENNQYIITTTDGRTLSYDQIQNYVKTDKPISVKKEVKSEQIPSEVQAMLEEPDSSTDLLPEDAAMLGNLYNQPQLTTQVNTKPTPSVATLSVPNNNYIIEKALAKTTIPSVSYTPKWNKFPKREIEMLMELMDVTKEEIINWYISKMDKETLYKEVSKSLEKYVSNQLEPEPQKETAKTSKRSKTNTK